MATLRNKLVKRNSASTIPGSASSSLSTSSGNSSDSSFVIVEPPTSPDPADSAGTRSIPLPPAGKLRPDNDLPSSRPSSLFNFRGHSRSFIPRLRSSYSTSPKTSTAKVMASDASLTGDLPSLANTTSPQNAGDAATESAASQTSFTTPIAHMHEANNDSDSDTSLLSHIMNTVHILDAGPDPPRAPSHSRSRSVSHQHRLASTERDWNGDRTQEPKIVSPAARKLYMAREALLDLERATGREVLRETWEVSERRRPEFDENDDEVGEKDAAITRPSKDNQDTKANTLSNVKVDLDIPASLLPGRAQQPEQPKRRLEPASRPSKPAASKAPAPTASKPMLTASDFSRPEFWTSLLAESSKPTFPWGPTKRWTCCKSGHQTMVESNVCANLECQHERCSRCRM